MGIKNSENEFFQYLPHSHPFKKSGAKHAPAHEKVPPAGSTLFFLVTNKDVGLDIFLLDAKAFETFRKGIVHPRGPSDEVFGIILYVFGIGVRILHKDFPVRNEPHFHTRNRFKVFPEVLVAEFAAVIGIKNRNGMAFYRVILVGPQESTDGRNANATGNDEGLLEAFRIQGEGPQGARDTNLITGFDFYEAGLPLKLVCLSAIRVVNMRYPSAMVEAMVKTRVLRSSASSSKAVYLPGNMLAFHVKPSGMVMIKL